MNPTKAVSDHGAKCPQKKSHYEHEISCFQPFECNTLKMAWGKINYDLIRFSFDATVIKNHKRANVYEHVR